MSEKQLVATYDRDSKRYHRYNIDLGQSVIGTLYVSKDAKEIPKKLTIELRVKNENGG